MARKTKPRRPAPRKAARPVRKKTVAKRAAAKAKPVAPHAYAIESMLFAHDFAMRACEGFPDDKVCFQNAPVDNHPVWTLGHLASSYDWFAGLLDGRPSRATEAYQKLFGFQSKPTGDPGVYPPVSEVRSRCDAAWDRLVAAARATRAADWTKPTLADAMGFAKDRLTLLERIAWHDGWHAGQVSTLRRSLGLPSLMG